MSLNHRKIQLKVMFKSDKSNLNADVTAQKSSWDQECQDGVYWAVGFFMYSYVLWINILS